MYVEGLIGKDTVNTVPDATLAAFRDHGEAAPTLTAGLDAVDAQLAALVAAGIDLDQVGDTLQQQGLALFDNAYRALLELTA